MTQWIEAWSADRSARFVLGTVGDNPLVCFGINPSTAAPGKLDPTTKKLSRFAEMNGHDSWIMLNAYPQIETDPQKIHQNLDPTLKAANERHISKLFESSQFTVLAAWSDLVRSRPYFAGLIKDIVSLPNLRQQNWVSLGELTAKGHPRHPSRAS